MYYDIPLSKLSDLTIITTSIYEIAIFCSYAKKRIATVATFRYMWLNRVCRPRLREGRFFSQQ